MSQCEVTTKDGAVPENGVQGDILYLLIGLEKY